jgi:hypothetical protein
MSLNYAAKTQNGAPEQRAVQLSVMRGHRRRRGSVIAGIVSWSTGANNASGCGGLTGVTPLALYRDWILKTARSWTRP